MDAFLWLKMRFLFSVNVYTYLFLWCFFIVKMGFLFGVNVYVFIPMVLFMVKNEIFI